MNLETVRQECRLPAAIDNLDIAVLCLDSYFCSACTKSASHLWYDAPTGTVHANRVRECINEIHGTNDEPGLLADCVGICATNYEYSGHVRWANEESLLGKWNAVQDAVPASVNCVVNDAPTDAALRLSVCYMLTPMYEECFESTFNRIPEGFMEKIHNVWDSAPTWTIDDTVAVLEGCQ